MTAYERSIALAPEVAESFFNLGNVLRELGRLEEASRRFQAAVSNDPTLVQAWYNLADLQEEGAGEEPTPAPSPAPDAEDAGPGDGRVIPDTPIAVEGLDAADAKLDLAIAKVVTPTLTSSPPSPAYGAGPSSIVVARSVSVAGGSP